MTGPGARSALAAGQQPALMLHGLDSIQRCSAWHNDVDRLEARGERETRERNETGIAGESASQKCLPDESEARSRPDPAPICGSPSSDRGQPVKLQQSPRRERGLEGWHGPVRGKRGGIHSSPHHLHPMLHAAVHQVAYESLPMHVGGSALGALAPFARPPPPATSPPGSLAPTRRPRSR